MSAGWDVERFTFQRFSYDYKKRETNIRIHGIDFEDITQVFEGPIAAQPQFEGGEERWQAIAQFAGYIIFIVFTERDEAQARCHFISARLATAEEKRAYRQFFG